MRRYKSLTVRIAVLIVVVFMLNLTACGTILYPERRGQKAGQIDVGVALLDAVGMLFFFIPGVIAFAVDFSTGSIYLPPDSARLDFGPAKLQSARVIQTKRTDLNQLTIETLVGQQIGQAIELTSPETKVAGFVTGEELSWGDIEETMTPNQFAAFQSKAFVAYK